MEKQACALDGWAAGWEVEATTRVWGAGLRVQEKRPRAGCPSLYPKPCPLHPGVSPDAACVGGHHGLSLVAAERFAEFVKISNDSVHAEHAGRMRIDFGGDPAGLIPDVLAPNLAVGDEEALRLSVAIDLLVDALALLRQRVLERLPGDVDAAIVRGVLAQG